MSEVLSWRQVACRHGEDRECLASFFAWQSAEVLAGGKPANLFNVLARSLPCGRDMAALWDEHADEVAARSDTRIKELVRTETRTLVLVYRPQVLAATLAAPRVSRTLKRLGYPRGSLPGQLDYLYQRMQRQTIPHEIGFFLGYPVKDVLAFMGELDLPLARRGPWVIYGDARRSLELVDHFGAVRDTMRANLATAGSPFDLPHMNTLSKPLAA